MINTEHLLWLLIPIGFIIAALISERVVIKENKRGRAAHQANSIFSLCAMLAIISFTIIAIYIGING
jgi:hypothetical protein